MVNLGLGKGVWFERTLSPVFKFSISLYFSINCPIWDKSPF